jgi:thiamine biosynthesis lipoprotein
MSAPVFILENFKALGTIWFIEIFEEISENKKTEIQNFLEKYILDFQNKYSRFLADSTLNNLNYEKEISFDKDLWEMISLGLEFSKKTKNIFNLFIKKALENKGYGKIEREEKEIIINENKEKVYLENGKIILNSNEQIDLGGIGKGFLIDSLAEICSANFGLRYFLINGGGDIYATSDNEKEIEIFLENPIDKQEFLGSVFIKNKSFCASSSFKRSWIKNQKQENHFVNNSDSPIVAASFVVSETTTKTDVLATLFCILAEDENKIKNLQEIYNIEYLVLNKLGQKFHTNLFNAII